MIGFYKRHRVININVNIVLASLLSILISSYIVDLTYGFFESMLVIVLSAYFIDSLIDFAIFAALHGIVNNGNGFRPLIMDIGKIQAHRIALAVIFFLIATGLDYVFMGFFGIERAYSFIFAYTFALLVTRVVHTIYGLKTGLFSPKHGN
jgi:hypothetical protein